MVSQILTYRSFSTPSHAGVTAVLSTAIFLVEPPARREIIVVYTWWRVAEAMLGKWLKIVEPSEPEPFAAQSLSAEKVVSAAMVGLAAGCCQPWS